MASTRNGHFLKGRHMRMQGDELLITLEEADKMVREEIRREIDSKSSDTTVSSRLACLLRCRADVQSAITSLLGASG